MGGLISYRGDTRSFSTLFDKVGGIRSHSVGLNLLSLGHSHWQEKVL